MGERGCKSAKEVRTSLRARPEIECTRMAQKWITFLGGLPPRKVSHFWGTRVVFHVMWRQILPMPAQSRRDWSKYSSYDINEKHHYIFKCVRLFTVIKWRYSFSSLWVGRGGVKMRLVLASGFGSVSWTATITRYLQLVWRSNCTELIPHTLVLSAWSFAKVHKAAITSSLMIFQNMRG